MTRWIGVLALVPCLAASPSAFALVAAGDAEIQYTFPKTGETLSYELFVPSSFKEGRIFPLVVVLHGAGVDSKTLLRDSTLDDNAEKLGYVLVAPKGYDKFGGFGGTDPAPADNGASASKDPKIRDLSEAETLAVIADVQTRMSIDKSRVYLMGNGMGAVGAVHLAAKFPAMWAAIAPAGGSIAALREPLAQLKDKGIAVFFVHGEADDASSPSAYRQLADSAKNAGIETQYVEVPRGDSSSAWIRVIPEVFAFFGKHARQGTAQ